MGTRADDTVEEPGCPRLRHRQAALHELLASGDAGADGQARYTVWWPGGASEPSMAEVVKA